MEKKLDCVILGLLSHEELTGYEIKKRMDTALHYFWGASYGSIYPTLDGLVERALAIRRELPGDPRKKQVYAITDAGRDYLREWLKRPAERDEIRYETLLKLFFGNEGGPAQAIAHIEAFQAKLEAEQAALMQSMERLRAVLDQPDSDETHMYYYLTAEFGRRAFDAYLEWCREAKELLEKKLSL